MKNKLMTVDDVVDRVKDGMTVGIGGWGSRRKPMALIRALCRSDVQDLTVVSYGGPDVGLLCAAGKVRKLVAATLDDVGALPERRHAAEDQRLAVGDQQVGGVGQLGQSRAEGGEQPHRAPFRRVFDVVAFGRRHVVMGATQVDRHGNENISCIGDFAKPTRQLLGVRGAPGNTVNKKTSYWVPRHSARVFVEQVDMVSGVGRTRAEQAGPAATRFHQLHRVVSNLGVLDFEGPGHTMRVVSVHPGVTVDEVREASGCEIAVDGRRSAARWRSSR